MTTKETFSNITALIAEDNEQSRTLLGSTLRNAGIGRIVAKEDGRDAIQFLEQVAKGADPELYPPVKAVFANWDMGAVNGLLLLRWVRRHRLSPNRFMPFVLLAPDLTKIKVGEAINAGAHEVIPKPFPGSAVNRALENLVVRHRPFIRTPLYFGPDRRRKRIDFSKMERRKNIDPVVGETEEAWDQSAPDVHFYRIPNPFLEQPEMKTDKSGSPINDQIVQNLKDTAEDYADWIKSKVQMVSFCLEAALEEPSVASQSLPEINRTAEELRAQAAVFGYTLLASLAKSLSAITTVSLAVSDKKLSLIKAHVEAMEMIVKIKLKGDGGEQGRVILKSLTDANRQILR